jgi:hypothetical protein
MHVNVYVSTGEVSDKQEEEEHEGNRPKDIELEY